MTMGDIGEDSDRGTDNDRRGRDDVDLHKKFAFIKPRAGKRLTARSIGAPGV